MAMESIQVYPGEGVQVDFQVQNVDLEFVKLNTWTVTGALIGVDGTSISSDLDTGLLDENTVRVTVRGALTAGLAGKKAVVKVIGTDPADNQAPVVRELLLCVGSI